MTTFEMIKYHNQSYPADVPLKTEEIAAHFDIQSVSGNLEWSLHTEYSYGKRNFDSPLISRYPEIVSANKDGVPQLWKSEAWAAEFADFIVTLTAGIKKPKVIEIHPSFNDYTDINGFISVYSVFESKTKEHFPDTEILIENRCGSVYSGGKFVISKMPDIAALRDAVIQHNLSLKLAFDIPQIYTAHNATSEAEYIRLLEQTEEVRDFIGGVHLWGKRKSPTGRKVSHCGDLTSYFEVPAVKELFLQKFNECFNDGVARKMVLEVNSGNEDMMSIVSDLKRTGILFV